MKKITLKTVQAMVDAAIAENQKQIDSHNRVKELISTVEGKPANKITFTAKKLGDDFNFWNDQVSHQITDCKSGLSHSVAYLGRELSIAGFEALDTPYGVGAVERIEKLKKLDINKLHKVFSTIQKNLYAVFEGFGEIESFKLDSYNNPIYYQLFDCVYAQDTYSYDIGAYKLHYSAKGYAKNKGKL